MERHQPEVWDHVDQAQSPAHWAWGGRHLRKARGSCSKEPEVSFAVRQHVCRVAGQPLQPPSKHLLFPVTLATAVLGQH